MMSLRANKNQTGMIKHYRSLVMTTGVALLLASLIGFTSTPAVAGFKTHNSNEATAAGSSKNYWSGAGWGLSGKQYGAIVCLTCHKPDASNIKTINSFITTPDNITPWASNGFKNVSTVFQNVTGLGSRTEAGRVKSYRVCEACHSQTAHHRYNSGGQTDTNSHYFGASEATQCVSCHGHDKGFVATCTACHGNPPNATNTSQAGLGTSQPTGATTGATFNAHSTHVKRKQMTCSVCHNNYTTSPMGNTKIEMGFAASVANWGNSWINTNSVTFGSFSGNSGLSNGYTYDSSQSGGTTLKTAASTRNSCNVYCHGGWAQSGKAINPSWVGTAQTACNNCHAATAANPPATGTHSKHAVNYAVSCTTCHPGRYAGDDHVKGAVHLKLSTLNAKVGAGATYTRGGTMANNGTSFVTSGLAGRTDFVGGTCTGIYCHSSGRAMGIVQYATTPTWGGTQNCLGCHGGRASASGAYSASNNGSFRLSSSHGQHLKYLPSDVNCTICHSKTVVTDAWTLKPFSSASRHVNNKRDVTFTGIPYGSYSSYKSLEQGYSGSNSKKCTNVSCHGGITRNSWSYNTVNNDNTCVHCHGLAGTQPGDPNMRKFSPGYAKQGTSTDQRTSTADLRVGAHFKHVSSVWMKLIKCSECHSIPPATVFSTDHMGGQQRYNSKTLNFAQSSSAVLIGGTTRSVLPNFGGYTSGTAAKPATCSSVYCHGNRLKNGDVSGSYRTPYWNYSAMINYTDKDTACGRCHGNPPGSVSAVHTGKTKTISCGKCHTSVVDTTGTIINKSLHIDGLVEVTSCSACHGYPPVKLAYGGYSGLAYTNTQVLGASPPDVGKHDKHVNVKGISCQACHYNNTAGGHPSATVQMFFRLSSATWPSWNPQTAMFKFGSYSGNSAAVSLTAASNGGTTKVVNTVALPGRTNTCNVYCHGGWNGSNKKLNPVWSGTASNPMNCGDCHGASADTTPLVGTHARHAGYAGATFANNTSGYAFKCTKCHPARYTGDTHIKGTVQVRFSTAIVGANATYTKTGGQLDSSTVDYRQYRSNHMAGDTPDGFCTNIKCHSSGRGANMGTVQYTTTAQWGTTNTVNRCLACHAGRASASGAYAPSINGGFKLSSTHNQHLKYPAANINCQMCHSKTVMNNAWSLKTYTGVSRHVNGVRDVTFTDITYGGYSSYKSNEAGYSGAVSTTYNYRKCANVSCHGGITRNAWSSTTTNNDNTCVHCHGTAGTGTGVANSGYSRRLFAPGWANTGKSTDQQTNSANIRVGAHFVHLSSAIMAKLKCNECHYVPNSPFDGTTHMAQPRYNSQTLYFGMASSATLVGGTSRSVLSVFTGYTNGTANKAVTCSSVYCHGNRLKNGDTGGAVNNTWRKPYWNYSGLIDTQNNKNLACGRCHGNPPDSVSSSHNPTGSLPVTATTSCSGCHSGTVDANGNIINKAKHINGLVEASGCNGCHGNPPNAKNTSQVNTPSPTGATTGATFNAHSTHVQVRLMTCSVCHNGFVSSTMGDKKIKIGFRLVTSQWKSWVNTSAVTFGSFSGNNALTNGFSYNATASPGTLINTGVGTRNSCNVYCHGGWTGSTRKINPSWVATGQNTCGNCHGATQAIPNTTNSHPRHVPLNGEGISCTTCHSNRLAGDNHVKGAVHIKFSTAIPRIAGATYSRVNSLSGNGTSFVVSGLAGRTDAGGSCGGNFYCHSNGRETSPVNYRQFNIPTWGTSTTDCLACHGGRVLGTGNYVPSSDGFRLSTTHSQHLKYPASQINCPMCHAHTTKNDGWTLNDFSAARNHVDGYKTVSFTNVRYGSFSTYKATSRPGEGFSGAVSTTYNYKKCTNVSCHGGTTKSAWQERGTLNNNNTCVHCHGVTGTTPANTTRNNYAPGWNKLGTSTDGNTSRQDVRVGAHFRHLSSIFMKKLKCNECHKVPGNPFDAGHNDQPRYNSVTLRFDQASTATRDGVSGTVLSVFGGYTAGTAIKAVTCSSVYCHGNRLPNGTTNGTYRTPFWNFSGMINQDSSLATRAITCGRCHGNPPNVQTAFHNGKAATTSCYACHGSVVDATGKIINKALHIDGKVVVGCIDCHSAVQNSPIASGLGGPATRPAIVNSGTFTFIGASNHKRSAATPNVATSYDCIVCHMEGDMATGKFNVTFHGNGYINLRDPDTGANIKGVTHSGTTAAAGAYTSTGTDATPIQFSRNLGTAAIEADTAAIMVNLCLHCHDSGGAASSLAWVPTIGSALKPFGATVAANPGGGVLDVSAQFAGTNRTFHPVLVRQNNAYANTGGTRMVAPWNGVPKSGTTSVFGPLITCWDCHAPNGTTSATTLTTSGIHGGAITVDAVPLRGNVYVTGTTNATNLCLYCHVVSGGTSTHGAGSAIGTATVTSSQMTYFQNSCYYCHSGVDSGRAIRPNGAGDYHGYNLTTAGGAFASAGSGYGFMRRPGLPAVTYKVGATTYSPTCGAATGYCSRTMSSYSPGGIY